MPRALIIEDSEPTQMIFKEALRAEGLEVSIAGTIQEGLAFLRSGDPYHVILLDLLLPDGEGFEILSELKRNQQNIPVFLTSQRAELSAKLTAFDLGADDYLVKPVNPAELRARVAMRLKKNSIQVKPADSLSRGNLVFQIPLLSVFVEENGQKKRIELTAKEFKIVYFLAKNEGHVFSRADIVKEVWGADVHVLDRTIDSHVCSARKKFGALSSCIQSIPNQGYRFSA